MRWLAGLALALALSVDGWGCGGFVQEYTPEGGDSGPEEGWCCDGMCGLSAEDATDLETRCVCTGVVQWHDGTIGDCIERTYQ